MLPNMLLFVLPAPPAPREGAARLLPPPPPREDAVRPITITNRARVEHLATAGLMLHSTDMILDDLLREVNERRVIQEHVKGLRRNAEFIIEDVVLQDPLFFSFVDDVAKEMLGVADKLKPPCRYFAQLHHALQTLKATVNALRDRDVVLSTPSPTSDLPATGPAVEPLAVDEEEAPASEKPLALEKKAAASEKPLALEEKAPASETPLTQEEKAAAWPASEQPKALAQQEKATAAASEKQKSLALEDKTAASEKLMAPINADLAAPEAHEASVATADAFRPGSTDGPAPDAAGVEDDAAA